jgi:hypothetical protein
VLEEEYRAAVQQQNYQTVRANLEQMGMTEVEEETLEDGTILLRVNLG